MWHICMTMNPSTTSCNSKQMHQEDPSSTKSSSKNAMFKQFCTTMMVQLKNQYRKYHLKRSIFRRLRKSFSIYQRRRIRWAQSSLDKLKAFQLGWLLAQISRSCKHMKLLIWNILWKTNVSLVVSSIFLVTLISQLKVCSATMNIKFKILNKSKPFQSVSLIQHHNKSARIISRCPNH